MIPRSLQTQKSWPAAWNSGVLPKSWAVRALVALLLAGLVLMQSGCEGDDPGLTADPLQSDSLPEFSDVAFEGVWLIDGEYAAFETKHHGEYLLAPVNKPDSSDSDDEPIPFRLKRAGDLLIMEYTVKVETAEFYRPCWINVNKDALEMYCLNAEELPKMGFEFETRKLGDGEVKLIRASQQQLKQMYNEQAMNRQVFEPTYRFTRPQPQRIARLKIKALRGNGQAQQMLAEQYRLGEIVAKDMDEAMYWAQKAAESGLPSGQVLYADLLLDSSRFRNELEQGDLQRQAHMWYSRAAESRFGAAYSRLGHLYESSFYQDESSALDAYRRGAELNDSDSHQQLGVRYYWGRGVVQDEHEAIRELELVPEASRDYSGWEALTNIYLSALDPDLRNSTKALYAAKKAADVGSGCSSHGLLAQVYFQNGQLERAVQEQQIATCGSTDASDERVATLAYYQSQVSGGYLPVPGAGGQ